jgi:TRAP-type mannitol/chloroaromatic compound transport system substrate-binding protein
LQKLINESGVKVYRTPESVFDAQLAAWDKVTANLTQDPFFAKVVESQKAWAKRVVYYHQINTADFKRGYEHVFGPLGF